VSKGKRTQSFQGANVLALLPEGKRLWYFNISGDKVTRSSDNHYVPDQPLPVKGINRDWRLLVQPRIDIAWLPTSSIFVRSVTLPPGDPAEVLGMVEFQLERLSPIPLTQIVWTAETMPSKPGEPQVALVTIASQNNVEAFLGTLEQSKYVVDRLDNPLVRELRSLPAIENGIRLIVEALPGMLNCLAAWFTSGKLQDVAIFQVPDDNTGAQNLVNQLTQTAWAAEMDGWLQAALPIHLHSLPVAAASLTPALQEWSGLPVHTHARLDLGAIAELSVREAVKERSVNLVPEEIRTRHRQQFIDGLWMRGLAAAGVAYMAIVLIYMVVLNVRQYQFDNLKDEVNGMARRYTNAIQLKAQVQILQEQVSLRYAALDCWKTVASTLPETLTLESMDFRAGHTLMLRGTATEDARTDIIRFNTQLHEATIDGKPQFAEVQPAKIAQRGQGGVLNWDFNAELKRTDNP